MRTLAATLVLALAACGGGTEPTPLAVTAVTPDEAASVLGETLTLAGTGLDTLATVALVSGTRRVELPDAHGTGVTSAEAAVPVGTPAALYDVEVKDASGRTATLPHAFKVVEGELRIEVVNIGQGDGAFIQAPGGRAMVIDGGRAKARADSIVPTLTARGITRPEVVLVSHFDADHLGGVVDLLRGPDGVVCSADDKPPATGLWDYSDRESTCNSDLCVDYYKLRACNKARIGGGKGSIVPKPGDRIPLGGGVKITVVAVNGEVTGGAVVPTGSDNSNSIALVVEFGKFRYYTSGDLTGGATDGCSVGMDSADVESSVAARVGKVDVLHVDHHGSCTSTNATFLRALDPQAAVISVGENNPYGHPHQDVLDRLGPQGAKLFLTNPGITQAGPFPKTRLPATAESTFGTVRIRSADGQSFTIEVLDDAGKPLVTREFRTR